MKVQQLHPWQVTPKQAEEIQLQLAAQVSAKNEVTLPHLIAGVDISQPNSSGIATGAVVVLHYPELTLVETKVVKHKPNFPYIPGLLSFRESPLILAACQQLASSPDLVLVDGQGIAHPRRLGIASHLGLLLDTPTIGCAKSRLCGSHEAVNEEPGSLSLLRDRGDILGAVLRTRAHASPIYVSIGHKIDLDSAIYWVMQCCHGYRIPEPLRLAHLAAGGRWEDKQTIQAATKKERPQGRLFMLTRQTLE